MVTLRMVALAVAILVGVPLLAAATDDITHFIVEGGEVASYNAEAFLEATNITLVEAMANYDRIPIHNVPEQLVEGHTVFLTIEIPLVRNVTNWTLDISGDVYCAHNVTAEGYYAFGIPNPTKVNRARAECNVGGEMYATPDPFYDSSNTFRSALQPTGNLYVAQSQSGRTTYTEEYSFYTLRESDDGEFIRETWYAYAAPILDPWLDADGTTKRWLISLPYEKVRAMDVREWTVVSEDDSRLQL